jgi:hypothetical protein
MLSREGEMDCNGDNQAINRMPASMTLDEYMAAGGYASGITPMPRTGSHSTGGDIAGATPMNGQPPEAQHIRKRTRNKRRTKRMTPKAVAANRRNGPKSKGPSPEGAKRSRGNRLTHGMAAQLPEFLIGEAGEDRAAYAELKAIVLEAYMAANHHDELVIEEYVKELWRRLHRIEPVERDLIRRRLLRRRRARGHDDTQRLQDLLAHNPAGLRDDAVGLRYLIDQLSEVLAATRALAADTDMMQPIKQLSARLQDTVVAVKELAAQALTKRPEVIAVIEGVLTKLRQTLAEHETAAADLDAIETTLCVLPSGKSGENLLRHLRRSDRRLFQLRRQLEPLRRRAADERETPPTTEAPTV